MTQSFGPIVGPIVGSSVDSSVGPIIGWISAGLLVATIIVQIIRQYREHTTRGVSPWLYVGQGLASSGLLVHSVLSRSWVFVALNIAMIVAAVTGLALWIYVSRVSRSREACPTRA